MSKKNPMKKSTKVVLITTISLIVAGVVLFSAGALNGGVSALNGVMIGDHELHVGKQVDLTKKTTDVDAFSSISIQGGNYEVVFKDSNTYSVTCWCEDANMPEVKVTNGTLQITGGDSQNTYNWDNSNEPETDITHNQINILASGNGPYIVISCPMDKQYADIQISDHQGDVEYCDNMKVTTTDISLTTGSFDCDGLKADSVTAVLETGEIDMEDCSLATLDAQVETGSVTLSDSLVSSKSNIIVNTGDVACTGQLHGQSDIQVDVGSAYVGMTDSADNYAYSFSAATGEVTLDGATGNKLVDAARPNQMTVTVGTGDLDVCFDATSYENDNGEDVTDHDSEDHHSDHSDEDD